MVTAVVLAPGDSVVAYMTDCTVYVLLTHLLIGIVKRRHWGLHIERLLYDAGAAKGRPMQYDLTPLQMASPSGHMEVVRLLCDAGAT